MKGFSSAPLPVQALLVLIATEAIVVFAVAIFLALELLSGNYQSIYAEIFLLVLAIAATFWIITFARQILNKKRWARSAAFFWQLLQGVIGAGALAEESSNRFFGAGLVIIAGASILLLFNNSVVEYTSEQADN